MARTKSPPSTNAPTSRKSKRTKPADAEITDVTSNSVVIVSDDAPYAKAQAILKELRAKGKASADALLIKEIEERGGHVYTAEEICKKFNVKQDPSWTQERIQWLGEVGEFLQPILQLRKQAEEVNTKYVVPGRKAMRKLVETAYALFVKTSESNRRRDVFEQLRNHLANNGVTVHKDAPDASVIIRTVFQDFDSKQVHLYGKSLDYARSQSITANKFAKFVSNEGGFEKIRTKALEANRKVEVKAIEKKAQSDDERVSEILEFRRTEPLIKLELTREQYAQLRPNVTVTTPDKNMDMVILLAEMDPYDFKMCNIYGTVPMTTELRKAINKAFSEFIIFDADFAIRFYAWKDKKAPPGPAKNAKERMAERATAWVQRDAERAAAKSTDVPNSDAETK